MRSILSWKPSTPSWILAGMPIPGMSSLHGVIAHACGQGRPRLGGGEGVREEEVASKDLEQ